MINDDSHAIPKSPRLSSAQGLEAHTLEFGVIKPGSGLHHRRWCCTCQILLSCHKTVHLSFTLFSSLLEGIQHPIAIRFNRRQILPVGFELLFVFCFSFFFIIPFFAHSLICPPQDSLSSPQEFQSTSWQHPHSFQTRPVLPPRP